jgi:hypothetical protein
LAGNKQCILFVLIVRIYHDARSTQHYPFKPYWSRDAPTSLTFNNCTLCPHRIYVFCIYLKTNSDLCHLQYKLIAFYNRDEKCLQRGTDWVFKLSGLRFVFKGLNGTIFLSSINLLKLTGHVMQHQFNIQQFYALPTLYLCVLYLSENKRRIVPLTA